MGNMVISSETNRCSSGATAIDPQEMDLTRSSRKNPVQFLNPSVLLVNRELGVTDNVDEQDMGDFEFDLFLNLNGHLCRAH